MKQIKLYLAEKKEWDLNSQFHQSEIAHPYQIWFKKRILQSFGLKPGNKSILEVGCGVGSFCCLLKNNTNQVYGVDFSSKMITLAKTNCPSVNFRQASADKLPFANKSFDAVVAIMLFHHLQAQGLLEKSLREIKRVLKPGGEIYILDHSGSLLSNFTLAVFNFAKKIFVILKGNFTSSGSNIEIPFSLDDSFILKDKELRLQHKKPVFTVFFQFSSAFSHGVSYLGGEKLSIAFEKISLPLIDFLGKYLSFSLCCTEQATKFVKK